MESKKINQLATELAPELSDLTIIGDPTTGISKKITLSQMASLFTGTVEEYANLASFPLVGTADTIYIALDTNIIYRWNTGTSAYVELSPNIVTSLVFNDANGFDGTISLVGSTATLTITTALTQGSIGFIGASGALTQDNSNFFWDNTNKRLGINTNTPTTAIDAFGSGIIGRLNGTSTNNAFLGFASAGSNKWSIGNVQSDHRFRIYNEATTSELVSVLQTGEFGIGIANPLTKLHIFGGASALIANLDANTSVAKSISFRSGNSSRINLEVSGTESGSNAGMNFYLRAYTDAGALLSTPLTITRSTGNATFSNNISVAGVSLSAWGSTFGIMQSYYGSYFGGTSGGGTVMGNNNYFDGTNYKYVNTDYAGQIQIGSGNILFRVAASGTSGNNVTFTNALTIASTGAATFSSSINSAQIQATASGAVIQLVGQVGSNAYYVNDQVNNSGKRWRFGHTGAVSGYDSFDFYNQTDDRLVMTMSSSGNIGIGTTTPFAKLSIGSPSGITSFPTYSTNDQASINYWYWASAAEGYTRYMDIVPKGAPDGTYGGSVIRFLTNTITNASNPIERMRITSGGYTKMSVDGTYLSTGAFHEMRSNAVGNLAVFQQTASSGVLYGVDVYYSGQAPNNTTSTFITFYDNVNTKAIIYSNGTFGSRTSTYGGISDIKLKENITPATNKLNDLLKVNVVNYNFIDDENKEKQLGVIAQELEEIFPNMVFETEDKETGDKHKNVKYSIFVPMLIKAIQELSAKVTALENK